MDEVATLQHELAEVEARLASEPFVALQAVRLVSHQLRLLGVLHHKPDADWLAIIDLDRRER